MFQSHGMPKLMRSHQEKAVAWKKVGLLLILIVNQIWIVLKKPPHFVTIDSTRYARYVETYLIYTVKCGNIAFQGFLTTLLLHIRAPEKLALLQQCLKKTAHVPCSFLAKCNKAALVSGSTGKCAILRAFSRQHHFPDTETPPLLGHFETKPIKQTKNRKRGGNPLSG